MFMTPGLNQLRSSSPIALALPEMKPIRATMEASTQIMWRVVRDRRAAAGA